MKYTRLLIEAEKEGVDVNEYKFNNPKLKGLYCDGVITLNSNSINTESEKACILAEELGHYFTTEGDILDQSNIDNKKKEIIARRWAYKKLVGITDLITASKEGIRNNHELAEFLDVSEEFLIEALNYYKSKYGMFYSIDNYIVYFDPLGVIEKFL